MHLPSKYVSISSDLFCKILTVRWILDSKEPNEVYQLQEVVQDLLIITNIPCYNKSTEQSIKSSDLSITGILK